MGIHQMALLLISCDICSALNENYLVFQPVMFDRTSDCLCHHIIRTGVPALWKLLINK